MYFQASEYKGRNFLELNNNNNILIHLTYTKDRAWLKYFSSSNLLCACIARLVTNHAPISEYRLEFFRKEPIAYPYSNYPIKTRWHVLFECSQYKKSWNLKRELLKDILTFLEYNSGAFCFQKGITWREISFFWHSCSLYFLFTSLLFFFFSFLFLSSYWSSYAVITMVLWT